MTAMKYDLDKVCALVMPLIMCEPVKYLAGYIEPILRKHSQDWWQRCVLSDLTPEESQRLRNKTISDLDLPILLRVLNFNWAVFRKLKNLTSEDRNYAKEMQTVRARWAHRTTKGIPSDIIYRDLDTLGRFACMIEAPTDFIEKVKAVKKQISLTPPPPIPPPTPTSPISPRTFKELLEARTMLSSKETTRYTNFCKRGGKVKFQLHRNPHGVDLAIPEADENLPSCKTLKQVDIKRLYGYWGSNKDWLEGNEKRFTKRPAVAFHLPEEMKDNSEHAGWKELDRLLEYAENR